MLSRLPPESATQTAMRDEHSDEQLAELAKDQSGHGPWSHTDHLLAGAIDAVNQLSYLMTLVNTPEDKPRPDPPGMVPRPGVVDPATAKARRDEQRMQRWMARQAEREKRRHEGG